MSTLNDFQIQVLQNTLDGNTKKERSSQLKAAEPGFYFLTFDRWNTAPRKIPQKGENESYWHIAELVDKGFLLRSSARQPVSQNGFQRIDFYHVTPLGRQELATIRLEKAADNQ